MKLQSYKIIPYELNQPKHTISIPIGATLLKLKPMHDGIYGWFEVSDLAVDTKIRSFLVLRTGDDIPSNGTFTDILDISKIMDDGQEALIVFPIYEIDETVVPMF